MPAPLDLDCFKVPSSLHLPQSPSITLCISRLIKTLQEFGYTGFNMVVINDANLEDDPEWLKAEHFIVSQPNTTYRTFPEAIGISLGRNEAVKLVTTQYFVQLDDDVVFTSKTNVGTDLKHHNV